MENTGNFRLLTQDEISALKNRNCTSENWHGILVRDFVADRYFNVNFSGSIKLGSPRGMVTDEAGMRKPCGIYNATLHNCTVGDNVRISGVTGSIANYRIGNNTSISSVGSIYCHKNALFGNGTVANVMDETGGRAVKFYDRITAQIAYMAAIYRHRPEFHKALEKIGDDYIETCRADFGTIGSDVKIENCQSICDVNVGNHTHITNVSSLRNGTIGHNATVANSVVAENFIISSQAKVTNGSLLENAFIGQATTIANGFTATHSLIFANCNMQCGEACSIIAGPHAETHHKSSLLIGGVYSFFNAGSGTNQSNHMYRLGPMHHGIMERGCKTGSNSYVLWPAHFGQMSKVIGSHYNHPDTSMFPYSTVLGKNGKTYVMPGALVCTSGVIRDLLKWPKRDKRNHELGCNDIINYDIINPLNVSKMYRGLKLLTQFDIDPDVITPYNFSIKENSISAGRENYAFAIDFFLGKYLASLINKTDLTADKPLAEQLFPGNEPANEGWIDILGLMAPRNCIRDRIVVPVAEGEISTLTQLLDTIADIHANYHNLVTEFIHQNFEKAYGIPTKDLTPKALFAILSRWTDTITIMEQKRVADGIEEFSDNMKIGFGSDDKDMVQADFEAVRGNPEDNEQLKAIHDHYTSDLNTCYHAINKLKQIFA